MGYSAQIESMQLCQMTPDEFNSKSFTDDYEAEIATAFKKSVWLKTNIMPSSTKIEFEGDESTSKG